MIIETLAVGSLGANCYIIGCSDTKEGVVIDPGGSSNAILNTVKSLGLNIKYIIDTHGHIDHIGANDEVKKATGAEVIIHEDDKDMLTNHQKNLSMFMGEELSFSPADRLVKDGDTIEFGNLVLEVIHTPGHTRGGITLKLDQKLFVGDTLFAGSIGRTDFPGGSYEDIIKSIKTKLLVLPEDTKVYPGHGPVSTIGYEKKTNPFLV